MKQEDKYLLIRDLCARLPYGIIVKVYDKNDRKNQNEGILYKASNFDANCNGTPFLFGVEGEGCLCDITEIKPYLRPMSSMNDEEKSKVQSCIDIVTDENYGDGYSPSAWDSMNEFVAYCDSLFLDHRGLIWRGLALEAPEGMYK